MGDRRPAPGGDGSKLWRLPTLSSPMLSLVQAIPVGFARQNWGGPSRKRGAANGARLAFSSCRTFWRIEARTPRGERGSSEQNQPSCGMLVRAASVRACALLGWAGSRMTC